MNVPSHQKTRQGFTLIELLVVIAIIGMLSAVILSALDTARGKGKDAAVKEDLESSRSQAELYHDGAGNGSYSGFCISATMIQILGGASQASQGNSTTYVCNNGPVSGSTVWAAQVPLTTSGQYWCADWTGSSKQESSALGSGVTTCP